MTTLDVTDYGAAGDGSTDDTAAIQAAIDDASAGDTVYLPAPSDAYLISHADKASDNGGILTLYGNSHPDNLTIAGDGAGSVIRLETGHQNNYMMLRVRIQDGIGGLVVRDLTFDGSYDDQYGTNVGHALAFDETTTAAQDNVDILVEDVRVHDLWRSGFNVSSGGVTLNRVTADTCGRHGVAINTTRDGGIHTPRPTVRNAYTVNCGFGTGITYGINADSRDMVVEDCVIDGCAQGTKVTKDANSCEYRRVRVKNIAEDAGFQRPGTSGSVEVTWDDVVFENCDGLSMRCGAGDSHVIADGGTVVCTNNAAEKRRDVLFTDGASLSASGGELYVSDSSADAALDWSSSDAGSLGYYGHDGNASADLDNNGGLSIGTRESARTADLSSVPTASEVGAWSSGGSTDDGSTTDGSGFDSWTPRWAATTDDWGVVSGTGFEGGNALQFANGNGDRARFALSWDDVGQPADVETLDRFRVPSFTADSGLGFHARMHLRASTSSAGENGYWVEAETPADSFRLAKYTDGSLTTLARFGTPAENTFYYRRFRAEGDTLQAKVWPAGETEPDGWDVSVTDTDHTDGWVGPGSFDAEATETDVVGVGVGGASAPVAPADDPPAVAWVDPAGGATVSGDVAVGLDASDPEDADDSLTVEYRVDGGAWTAASYDTDAGLYTASWDSTGVADGSHTLSARATDGTGNTATAAVDVTVDNGTDSTESLAIDRFDVADNSNPAWSRFDVDWAVSDADGDLNTVVTELRYGGVTVAAESSNVTGSTASHSHELRVKGAVDEVWLSVNDSENSTVSESKSV